MSNKKENGGPRKWSGGLGEEKYLVPLPDIEPRTVQFVSLSLNRLRFPTHAQRAQTVRLQPHELSVSSTKQQTARGSSHRLVSNRADLKALLTVLGRQTEGRRAFPCAQQISLLV